MGSSKEEVLTSEEKLSGLEEKINHSKPWSSHVLGVSWLVVAITFFFGIYFQAHLLIGIQNLNKLSYAKKPNSKAIESYRSQWTPEERILLLGNESARNRVERWKALYMN